MRSRFGSCLRRRILLLAGAAIAAPLLLGATASADIVGPLNFESYAPGPVHLQDGWSSAGAAGGGCAVYDHGVVVNAGAPASFGTKSLRISNAVTSGCFGDQTFSKSTVNEAGESGATNGGMSGGARQGHFEAQWQFASTVPGAEQPGLSVVASPDRGDGARMSWVEMKDTPSGLAVNFYNYKDNAPLGTLLNMGLGCGAEDDFFFTTVASGLSRAVPHTVRISMDLVDGPLNDVVKIYVDGTLRHTDTSWEDYFRWCEATGVSRTVDSILFRTGGTAAPATAGKGFLIDNLTFFSSTKPVVTLVSKEVVLQAQPFQGAPYGGGWVNKNIRITLNCTDPTGVNPPTVKTVTLSVETDTAHYMTNGDCANNVGTYADPIDVGHIHIDRSKPVISSSRSPAGGGWVNTDILVSFSCTDPGPVASGIATDTVPDVVVTTNLGSIMSTGSCADNAGNAASRITVNGLRVDKTNPSCSLRLTRPYRPDGSMKGAAIRVYASDSGGSGVEPNSIELVSITPAGAGSAEAGWNEGTYDTDGDVATVPGTSYTWVYSVMDKAGNTGTCQGTMTF